MANAKREITAQFSDRGSEEPDGMSVDDSETSPSATDDSRK